MRKRIVGIAVVFAAAMAWVAPAQAERCPTTFTAQDGRDLAGQVWHPAKWERGQPPGRVLAASVKMRRCAAGPGHRQAMASSWRSAKRAYYRHRAEERWRERWTPHWGCTSPSTWDGGGTRCKWWAIPAYIVDCESGGDYAPSIPGGLNSGGAYGLLVSTYREFGGRFGSASEAPPKEQDRIARELWERDGTSPWACA